jgi:hypothetical protein
MRSAAIRTSVAAFLALVLLSDGAAADDPLFLNWATALPATAAEYDPSSLDDCSSGKIQCVDKVIREMTRRFDGLAATCNHDAIFALAYLRTTEEYRRAAATPGFFSDHPFLNFEDAVFARYYFQAYDSWHAGNKAATPPAWQVALDAADKRAVNADTNALLGINAHIQRDLPFVLWEIGLVKPDGTSRKADHDKVNEFLNRVSFYPEANARFDASLPTDDGPAGGIHSIIAMRENAWRNAERLAAAEDDPVALALVKQSIEQTAHAAALAIKTSGSYGPLSQNGASSAARDAYCAANHG